MNIKVLFAFFLILVTSSCLNKTEIDLVIHNANIHTMDEDDHVYQAIAINNGKIIEIGAERQILNKFSAEETIDAKGKDVYPGLTDAHVHLLSAAKQKLQVDLNGSKSFDEVLVRLERYQSKNKKNFIIGRGWDQSLWVTQDFPTNERLNQLFPTIPVCLIRVDGHALLANDAMLKLAGLNESSVIEGGIIQKQKGKCTGFVTDNAMNPIYDKFPPTNERELIQALLEIEIELLQYGITGVHEAGIEYEDIALFKKLIDKHNFKISTYAMLMPSEKNINFAKKNGIYFYKNLTIRSFKLIADGALGSRGAYLKHAYSDEENHYGVLTATKDKMEQVASVCLATNYQMNTHAIGDSANKILLQLYERAFKKNPDHRWRIEHAQVIDPTDFVLFQKYQVIPSVQPSHATSDQRWAEQRLGKQRMKGAYAYQTLLNNTGIIAIGTDYPIEPIDPFNSLYAATQRRNQSNQPMGGFYVNEAISLDDFMRGMTIWAALASFKEYETGTLEVGKEATIVIFNEPVQNNSSYKANFAYTTIIKGRKVFSMD
ncbi:MAG: amidohydrolase [Bacteroidota bacterium]